MHTTRLKLSPQYMLEVLVFKAVTCTKRFHDVCRCEFGVRDAQALLWKCSAHQLNK